MKYEGVTSESESEDEKLNEDKSRQGFSPAPPSFKRPNVLAVTPGHTPASITMPSPRGIMQVSEENVHDFTLYNRGRGVYTNRDRNYDGGTVG